MLRFVKLLLYTGIAAALLRMGQGPLRALWWQLREPVSLLPALPYLLAWAAAALFALAFLVRLAVDAGFDRRMSLAWPGALLLLLGAAIVGHRYAERLSASPFYTDLRGAPPEVQSLELMKRLADRAVTAAHAAPDGLFPNDPAAYAPALLEKGEPLLANYSFRLRRRPFRLAVQPAFDGPQLVAARGDLPGTIYLCVNRQRTAVWLTAVGLVGPPNELSIDVLARPDGKIMVVSASAADPAPAGN